MTRSVRATGQPTLVFSQGSEVQDRCDWRKHSSFLEALTEADQNAGNALSKVFDEALKRYANDNGAALKNIYAAWVKI